MPWTGKTARPYAPTAAAALWQCAAEVQGRGVSGQASSRGLFRERIDGDRSRPSEDRRHCISALGWTALRTIPTGKTTTYGRLAAGMAGQRQCARLEWRMVRTRSPSWCHVIG